MNLYKYILFFLIIIALPKFIKYFHYYAAASGHVFLYKSEHKS